MINDFKARFPEFVAATVDQHFPVIESVWPSYYGGAYSDTTKELILNLCAHLMYEDLGTGAEGSQQVESRTLGIISEKLSTKSHGGNGQFDRTKYGRRFMMLARSSAGAVVV